MSGTRRVWINLAVFWVLFVVMVGWAVGNIVSVEQIEHPYALAARFPNAFGVLPNAEVTYLGVSYGAVTSVEREPGGVIIRMQIADGRRIPAGATAAILRKSAIGEQYVDLSPPPSFHPVGAGDGPWERAGAVIPRERTTVPLEFSELLRSASALLSAVPPESVATLVHEAAVGLDGRGDSLRQLADAGDRIGATLAARTDALDRLATNNTRLTRVFAAHRQELSSTIGDLRALAATLRTADPSLRTLLDRGPDLLGRTADIVAGQKGNLDCDLKILEQVIDATAVPRRLQGLRALLGIGPRAFAGIWDSLDNEPDGPWIRVGLIVQPTNKAPQYAPPKELPPVRPVPACASALRPSGVDYTPPPPGGAPTLPAETSVGVVLALAMAGSALVIRDVDAGLRSPA